MKMKYTIIALLVVSLATDPAFADRRKGRSFDDSPHASASPTASASPSASPSWAPTPSPSASPTATPHFSNKKSQSSPKIELRSRLGRSEGSLTSGKVAYRSKRSDIRLRATIKIPLPSTIPALADLAAANSALVEIALARENSEYAVCSLVLDDDNEIELRPEFKLDVRQKGSTLRIKKGVCDTDLLLEGVQSAIPMVEVGDTITVRLEGGSPFLTGILQIK